MAVEVGGSAGAGAGVGKPMDDMIAVNDDMAQLLPISKTRYQKLCCFV